MALGEGRVGWLVQNEGNYSLSQRGAKVSFILFKYRCGQHLCPFHHRASFPAGACFETAARASVVLHTPWYAGLEIQQQSVCVRAYGACGDASKHHARVLNSMARATG